MEYDEFDTPAAAYILVVDEQNQALGTARLIPTTRPYMIETLWPNLVDARLPHSAEIWEASRFGCDRRLGAAARRSVVAQLIQGCQEFGLANGISSYLGVMPGWIFKNVIAAHGCPVRPLGPKLTLHGHDIEAAYIEVSSAVLDLVRQHTGIPQTLCADQSLAPSLSPRLAEDALSQATKDPAFSPSLELLVDVR